MHYTAASYYTLGWVYPRPRLREVFKRPPRHKLPGMGAYPYHSPAAWVWFQADRSPSWKQPLRPLSWPILERPGPYPRAN